MSGCFFLKHGVCVRVLHVNWNTILKLILSIPCQTGQHVQRNTLKYQLYLFINLSGCQASPEPAGYKTMQSTCMMGSSPLSYTHITSMWLPFTSPRVGPCTPWSIYFLIFSPFYLFLSFVGFTYFLLLATPSLSTRIVPLHFQAGGRRRRPNLGLVCFLCNLC